MKSSVGKNNGATDRCRVLVLKGDEPFEPDFAIRSILFLEDDQLA